MELAPGGLRLEARYTSFDRQQSMVFHFRKLAGGDATPADCKAVADAYGLWENSGFGIGYALLRGEFSHFNSANAFGISGTSRASFIDVHFARPGLIPDVGFPLLPTGIAPIVHWATAERGKATGRTYALGLTDAATDLSGDKSVVEGLYLDALTTIFGVLRALIEGATGFRMAHYTTSHRGGVAVVPSLLDITGQGVYALMGSQRRRTRP